MSLNPRLSAPQGTRPGVAPAPQQPTDLLRGVLWGLLFAAPVWAVAVVIGAWLIQMYG
ncbi:MAG TPA: hypothetical protein VFQ11_00815 [Nocardioidaceae bacterium]|nr:hypothetical protein [Nocardioidaceae bacterium]